MATSDVGIQRAGSCDFRETMPIELPVVSNVASRHKSGDNTRNKFMSVSETQVSSSPTPSTPSSLSQSSPRQDISPHHSISSSRPDSQSLADSISRPNSSSRPSSSSRLDLRSGGECLVQPDSSSRPGTSSRPGSTSRPSSALARGVQIVELSENRINPSPVITEEADFLLDEYLSPQKLRLLTGVDNLSDVQYLELKANTVETSLGNFGVHLPNLAQLKLANSVINSVRDLGSSLTKVKVLWMSRCGVTILDGVSSMSSLTELYLSYNEIADVSPCSMLEHLQILDLEGNNIDDIVQLTFLALCHQLRSLTLDGNPICVTPNPAAADAKYNYRRAVKQVIPHLTLLDDLPLEEDATGEEGGEEEGRRCVSVFDEDWKLLEELRCEGSIAMTDECVDLPGRPGTAVPQTATYRPGSALKPYTASIRTLSSPSSSLSSSSRPTSSALRPVSAASGKKSETGTRPGTSHSGDSKYRYDEDASNACELTTGSILCGNLSRALKDRRRNVDELAIKLATKRMAQLSKKTSDVAVPKRPPTKAPQAVEDKDDDDAEEENDDDDEDDVDVDKLAKDLAQWKIEHKRRLDAIRESKKPQVLKIDYDEVEELLTSDSDDVNSLEGDGGNRGDWGAGATASSSFDPHVMYDSISLSRFSSDAKFQYASDATTFADTSPRDEFQPIRRNDAETGVGSEELHMKMQQQFTSDSFYHLPGGSTRRHSNDNIKTGGGGHAGVRTGSGAQTGLDFLLLNGPLSRPTEVNPKKNTCTVKTRACEVQPPSIKKPIPPISRQTNNNEDDTAENTTTTTRSLLRSADVEMTERVNEVEDNSKPISPSYPQIRRAVLPSSGNHSAPSLRGTNPIGQTTSTSPLAPAQRRPLLNNVKLLPSKFTK